MNKDKYIIWSDMNIPMITDEWRDAYEEFLEMNQMNGNKENDSEVSDFICEMNNRYLEDERINLDVELNNQIIVLGDIGRWNGRFDGYKIIQSGNIRDCLYSDVENSNVEWYVDKEGEFRADVHHHDSSNYYLYRVFKKGISPDKIKKLEEKFITGRMGLDGFLPYTNRIGPAIAKVYGWPSPKISKNKKGIER